MKDSLNLPVLTDALDEIEFFERERTDRFSVELAIVLYNSGVSLRKTHWVLRWLGVERSHVSIWKWIVKFGDRLTATGRRPVAALPSVILMDETVVRQRGEDFVLFAALAPETREVVHLSVYPAKSYLTTRLFFAEIEELYGTLPKTVITDGAREYGATFRRLRIRHVVLSRGIRNRIERWIQEIKRRINVFYASFSGKDVGTTNLWLRQFSWFWNTCLC